MATHFLKVEEYAEALIRIFEESSCLKALLDRGLITISALERETLI